MADNASPQSEAGPKDMRVSLAVHRTSLALDRTTLAWLRTTMTLATFGFGTVGFYRALEQRSPNPSTAQLHEGAIWFGTALVVLGIVATVLSGASHLLTLRRLARGERPALSMWPLSITVAMLVSIAGLVALWLVLRP